jgi:hypothetical protein
LLHREKDPAGTIATLEAGNSHPEGRHNNDRRTPRALREAEPLHSHEAFRVNRR